MTTTLQLLDWSLDLSMSCLQDKSLLHPSVNRFTGVINKFVKSNATPDQVLDAWQNMPIYLQIHAAKLARSHGIGDALAMMVGELPESSDFESHRQPMF